MSNKRFPAFERIANPRVISWPLLLISTLVLIADDVRQAVVNVIPSRDVPGTLLTFVGITVAGQILAFGVLLLARTTWLKSAWARCHPTVTVATFVLASAAAQAVVAMAVPRSAASDVDRTLLQAISFTVVAIVVAATSEHRTLMRDLSAAQVGLSVAVEQGRTQLSNERSLVGEQVDVIVADALRALDGPIDDLPRTLLQASEETLRPLSHRLEAADVEFATDLPNQPRPHWRQVLSQVADRPLISPVVTAVVMTVVATRFTIRDPSEVVSQGTSSAIDGELVVQVDLVSFLTALAQLGAVFAVTYAAASFVRRGTKSLLSRGRLRERWAIALFSLIPVAILAQVAVAIFFVSQPEDLGLALSPLSTLQFLLPITAVAVVAGIVRTVSTVQKSLRRQLEESNAELSRRLVRIRCQLWAERQNLSRVVHGSLRGLFIAGAMGIENAAKDSAKMGEVSEVIEATRQRLIAARNSLTASVEPLDVSAALHDIGRTWAGVCEVVASISPEASQVLLHDQPAAEAALTIVNEAMLNALNHAQSKRIEISMIVEERNLIIQAVNSGGPLPEESIPGLGSRLLSSLCSSWTLEHHDGETTLQARLPVTEEPHTAAIG